jgi:diketogulonate reductase-like aldo/keto reductase
LITSCKESLTRIGIGYIDLFLIHAPSLDIPIEESMRAMEFLKNEGLIRNIGVSNFTVERFAEAQKYSKYKIVANQVHYNLQIREIERKDLIKYCQENDVMLIAWRPLQKGMLLELENDLINELCKKYNKTKNQIALNWLISQENVVTLSKTRDPSHLEENLGAIGWKMETVDIEKVRNEFPNQLDISDTVPLV